MIYDYIIEKYVKDSDGCIDFKAFMKALLDIHKSSQKELGNFWLKFAMFARSNPEVILKKDIQQMVAVSMLTKHVSDTIVLIQI